ncbi:MAG: hypothetical protein RLZ98_208 [Pseudomonadota bacterium]
MTGQGSRPDAEQLPDFTTVTEVAGEAISREQLQRMCHRYRWAGEYCRGRDVLEAGCGSGQGLGYLLPLARSLRAGDILPALVDQARAHYEGRVQIDVMDAADLPFDDDSLDVVILFEALYYLPDAEAFVREAKRVLRHGGHLLIATANKDMADFNPSPHSNVYHGAVELVRLMAGNGLTCELFGAWTYAAASPLQRILVPVKQFAVSAGLIPKTMAGKKLLKRMVFGRLEAMPAELMPEAEAYNPPVPVEQGSADRVHRVLYCAARKP